MPQKKYSEHSEREGEAPIRLRRLEGATRAPKLGKIARRIAFNVTVLVLSILAPALILSMIRASYVQPVAKGLHGAALESGR